MWKSHSRIVSSCVEARMYLLFGENFTWDLGDMAVHKNQTNVARGNHVHNWRVIVHDRLQTLPRCRVPYPTVQKRMNKKGTRNFFSYDSPDEHQTVHTAAHDQGPVAIEVHSSHRVRMRRQRLQSLPYTAPPIVRHHIRASARQTATARHTPRETSQMIIVSSYAPETRRFECGL